MAIKSTLIYLDNNATTRCDERVIQSMLPYFGSLYANPGSSHLFGLELKEAVEEATESLASAFNGNPANIIYTSGATEAINLAIKGLLPSVKKHILTVSSEHKAVLDTCSFLENRGYEVSCLSVDSEGMLDLAFLSDSVKENTLLVIVMLANNETGVIHPIKEICDIVHRRGSLLLCDATQAMGKIHVDVKKMGMDFLAFSAHKFYGPKGVGGLYISSGLKHMLSSQIHGGNQQAGLRSGTLNVPGIVGMGEAAAIFSSEMTEDSSRIKDLRDKLESDLLTMKDTFLNGHRINRLPNTSNICFRGVFAEELILSLGNISVSSGSACSSTLSRPSHVLTAMGLSNLDGQSSIRFSLGRFTTEEEINTTIETVKSVVNRLRNSQC